MIARRGSGWLAPALMLGVCAALAWTIYREFQVAAPEPVEAAGGRAPPLPDLPAGPSFVMAPAGSFSAILERPLFSPTRRPPAEGTVTIESAEPELEVTVVGIIISSEEQIAIIKPKGGSQLVRLSEGDSFQGWTLETIEPDRITFRRGDIEEHIELSYDEPPPVQKPRRKRRKTRETPLRNQLQNQLQNRTQPRTREENE